MAGPGNSRKFASGKIAKSFVAAARFCFIIIVMFNTHPPSTQTMFSCYQLFVLMRGQQHGKCGLLLRKLLYSYWDLGKSTDKSMTMIFQGVAQFFYTCVWCVCSEIQYYLFANRVSLRALMNYKKFRIDFIIIHSLYYSNLQLLSANVVGQVINDLAHSEFGDSPLAKREWPLLIKCGFREIKVQVNKPIIMASQRHYNLFDYRKGRPTTI